ncbi:MAG: VWA domain-containing protein [Microbacterium sp.]|uniref:VWA domain-containing protein n=1 Tax=Microbacterium sp. TaxID=51671 RepID=UPI003F7EDDE2
MVRVQPNTPASSSSPTRAEVRAAQQRKRSLILLAVVLGLVVALVVVIGVVFARGAGGEPAAEQPPVAAGGCLPSDLRITSDPAVAGAVQAIVDGMGENCPDATIVTEDSAATADALSTGAEPDFDVWVPDSAMWPARVTGQAERTGVDAADLVVDGALASTPVVFATTEPTAATLAAAEAGFSSFAQRSVAVVLPDPATVAASSAALLALQTALNGDARTFTALALGLDPGVTQTATAALDAVSAATTPTVAVTTEQAVQAYDEDAATPLVAVYPADVKPAVSVPLVTVAGASDQTAAAVKALVSAAADAGDVLAQHGFRDAAGSPPATATGDAETTIAAPDADTSANQAEALRTWQVLTAPSRMLSLNDVSGSMLQPVTADMRRIDLFEQAAVRAVNSLSADSSLATWVFSSRRIGGQDWQEIVPFGSLGDPAHKQLTIDTANSLDTLVGGGTGLYDSVLAAVTYMRQTYEPGKVNLVLLNTDGVNEDDDGLDLPGVLAELEKLRDPAKPVAVIAIGYGPDTDQAALEQIAAATDGAAYQALQPTDIGTVLIDAVTQRGCRPGCG